MVSHLRELLQEQQDATTTTTNSAVVVLPCLPLYLLGNVPSDITILEPETNGGASQLIHLSYDLSCKGIQAAYYDMLRGTYALTVSSLLHEKLDSVAVGAFATELEKEDNKYLFRVVSERRLDPSVDLYGPFGRLFNGLLLNAKLGLFDHPSPLLEDLQMITSYPSLCNLANLEERTLRYSKIVLVGDSALRSSLNSSSYLEGKSVAIFPNVAFTAKGFSDFTEKAELFPPNTLYVFFIDLFMFNSCQLYPQCCPMTSKKCRNMMSRYILDPDMDTDDEACWLSTKLEPVLEHLTLLKGRLPNQSSVIIGPISPQRVLVQESDPSFFNHKLMHDVYHFENKPIVFGPPCDWMKLHDSFVAELAKQGYVLDKGLENLTKAVEGAASYSPVLSCVTNPRLYDEAFPEKMAWATYMKEFLAKVEKLVFPGE